jgi:Derlin-2/3
MIHTIVQLITPFHIYFNTRLITQRREVWRLFTNFFYFGSLGLDFLFHMFFLVKYSKSLEEGSFRNRSADFLWMLLFGAGMLCLLAPLANQQFLGSSLAFMMVYVWARRHPRVHLSFLGVFTFSAAYLPWVLLAFSVMLGSSPVVDLLGMAAGHTYYYLEDVYPHTSEGRGRRLLKTPAWVAALFPQDQGVPVVAMPAGQRLGEPAQQPEFAQRPHED